MSEQLNEDLLNDATDDYLEIGEAEERALLKDDDDGDVLNIAPEDLPLESEHRNEVEEEELRQDKFATERLKITPPDTSYGIKSKTHKFSKQNHVGRGRGGSFYQNRGRPRQFVQGRPYNRGGQPGRNKTVLINPRFQGVVHVNNTARLAWDTQHQIPPNPWMTSGPSIHVGSAAPPVQQMPFMQPQSQMQHIHGPNQFQFEPPMQQIQYNPPLNNFQPPPQVQHIQQPSFQNVCSPGHQIQYLPSQPFMPQPTPPGSLPHIPNQQMFPPYPQNGFEHQNCNVHNNQPSNNQFIPPFNNTGGPPLNQQGFSGNQSRINLNPNRQVGLPSSNNIRFRASFNSNRSMMSPKRKISAGLQLQTRKRQLQQRLGRGQQPQVRTQNITVQTEDRPSVMKEVTVTNVTTVKIEDDDERTRDLRLKIEEQKRKRAEILRWKELRRLENLRKVTSQNEVQPPKQHLIKPVQQRQGQAKNRGSMYQQSQHLGSATRTPVLQSLQQVDDQIGAVNHFAKSAGIPSEEPDIQLDVKHMSTFLADRKVLVKDEALMSTRKVLIKNIATSTADKKIYQICKNIGEVQKLHRDKNDRHATITFKSVASAHAFFKKYQRHMLDLSMIEVALTPESDEQ